MKREQVIRRSFLAVVTVGLAVGLVAAVAANSATRPEGRPDEWWVTLHKSFLERGKKGPVELLFLGDSITQGWGQNAVWKKYYGPRQAANFGIGGDRTQHILWRLDHDEVEGLSPKAVVLMIGTNNVGANTPEEIAEGVEAIIKSLRTKLPKTKVLLLGVFPRGSDLSRPFITSHDKATPSSVIPEINQRISKFANGDTIHYLDIGPAFLASDGSIPKTLMPDFLHLSEDGYRAWAEAIEPTLRKLLGEPEPK